MAKRNASRKVNREPSALEAAVGRIIGDVFSLSNRHGTTPAAIALAVSRYFDEWEIAAAEIRQDVVARVGDEHEALQIAVVETARRLAERRG